MGGRWKLTETRSLRRCAVGTALIVLVASVAVLAQEKMASQRQVDAVNRKIASVGRQTSMKVGFDESSGDVTFRFTMKNDGSLAIGAMTDQGIMYLSSVAYEGAAREPRVASSSRIEINPDGSEGKTLKATEPQLAQLSRRFLAEGGKIDTLMIRIDAIGTMSYSFATAAGTKASDIIKR